MDNMDSSIVRVTLFCVIIILAFLWLPALVLAQEEEVNPNLVETKSEVTSTITTNGSTTTTLKSPPASAITPTINTSNSDLCTFGVAGAVQTQILGISTGTQFTDENCERLKNSKTLYDMGMKVAAVSTLCQDRRVFDAMMMAGTPCPYEGMIGADARAAWETNTELQPDSEKQKEKGLSNGSKTLLGSAGVASLLVLLLL